LGSIKKGQYGPFLSFDPSIKEIQVTREYTSNGDTIVEVLKVPVNESGYLESGNIQKIEDDFAFKIDQGWINESKAEETIAKLKSGKAPTSSFVKIKMES
jgi:hypothetical protein